MIFNYKGKIDPKAIVDRFTNKQYDTYRELKTFWVTTTDIDGFVDETHIQNGIVGGKINSVKIVEDGVDFDVELLDTDSGKVIKSCIERGVPLKVNIRARYEKAWKDQWDTHFEPIYHEAGWNIPYNYINLVLDREKLEK